MSLNTPILFLIFNRLDTTKQVFEEIRRAKPKQLFIACDGARNKEEEIKVYRVRNHVLVNIDWECEVKTLFRKDNLGCKYAVSGAIDWFFKNVEQGIILEDDCLPDKSFFKFCEKMLEKYKDDTRIMHISGNNFLIDYKRDIYSYYFSTYGSIWGWATWKRAWKLYDIEIEGFGEIEDEGYLKYLYKNKLERIIKKRHLNQIINGLDTWDYQWNFCKLINSGLSIIPNNNLIKNIGFEKGTRKFGKNDFRLDLELEKIEFPLINPPFVIRDFKSDRIYFNKMILNSIKHKLFK